MIRILITDDHEIIRTCLKYILKEEFKNVEFGEATSGIEALHKVNDEHWDLVIIDVGMNGMSGISVLKKMRQSGNKTPVLVISFNSDDMYAARALKTGATAFITKENAYHDLITASRYILLERDLMPGRTKVSW